MKKLDHFLTICSGLVSPPTKNNVKLDDWKYEASTPVIQSTISQPAAPTHMPLKAPTLLPPALISHDCSLSDTCSPPPAGTTTQPQIFTSNAP